MKGNRVMHKIRISPSDMMTASLLVIVSVVFLWGSAGNEANGIVSRKYD